MSELLDGYSKRNDGTTDDETFLRGIQITDSEGMVEFLTKVWLTLRWGDSG
jgi:protocatechuate 3,4-dioxygenase beta subunit